MDENLNSSIMSKTLPFDNFNNWIYSICVITFDLELGQTMECIYPKHMKLTDIEKSNVNYSSFPDSNSGCMGDTVFHFRMRSTSITKFNDKYSKDYPDYIKPTPNMCFGYVNFRQVRDKENRRGYFQKSVVLLSPYPFTNLFYKLVQLVSESYFTNGEIGLEVVCHNIDNWNPPISGTPLNLPLCGSVIQTEIPAKSTLDQQQQKEQNDNKLEISIDPDEVIDEKVARRIRVTSSFIEVKEKENDSKPNQNDLLYVMASPINQDCYTALGSVSNQLQVLWELILINQPLVVIANSPILCSIIVQTLVHSIAPLQLTQEYRPFFTIHDSEFKEFTSKTHAIPSVILGITNPFFVKALSHWPNILKVTDVKISLSNDKNKKNIINLMKQDEIKPGLYSNYKNLLQVDKQFIKSIQKGLKIERPSFVQSEIIRKFFLELTQSFMYPLERYVASLMPLKREIIPFKAPPSLKKFNLDEFLKSLETNGPQLTSGIKGDWISLYKQFYASSNFASWLSLRQHEISLRLTQIHTDILCRADLTIWIKNKPELELVDLLIQINMKRKEDVKRSIGLTKEQDLQLIHQINTIMLALPPDLQEMVKNSTSGTGAPRFS